MKLEKKYINEIKWIKPDNNEHVRNAEGKYYGDEIIKVGDTIFKFLKLESGIHSGKHNHKNQKMEEWHYIIAGEGEAIYYNRDGSIKKRSKLSAGNFSPKQDTNSLDHEFVNTGKKPLMFLGIERYSK